jgi:hypothetical protein
MMVGAKQDSEKRFGGDREENMTGAITGPLWAACNYAISYAPQKSQP